MSAADCRNVCGGVHLAFAAAGGRWIKAELTAGLKAGIAGYLLLQSMTKLPS